MDDSSLVKVQSTSKLFLTGPFGAGKTTLARERVRWLLEQAGATGDQIIVLVPQPINLEAYRSRFATSASLPGPPVEVTTVAWLARRAVELYWPLVAEPMGFADPRREPNYLNVEAVQYHLGRFVDEGLDRQEFAGIAVTRQRIILQLLNTLNRSALYGLTLHEAYDRLDSLPGGKRSAAHLLALRAARDVTLVFRAHCLKSSLVDFSLLMEIFRDQILSDAWRCTHLMGRRRHLVADNMEEDNPVSHALIRLWAPSLESVLVAVDEDASYRRLLGADAQGAAELAQICDQTLRLSRTYVIPAPMSDLVSRFDRALMGTVSNARNLDAPLEHGHGADDVPEETARTNPFDSPHEPRPEPMRVPLDERGRTFRYYPLMIRWVAQEIRRLVDEEGADPGAIVVVAPTIGDALRFSLQTELDRLGVASTAHRPSRALLDEPATRSLLTLASIAHPRWKRPPSTEDVQHALQMSIQGLDPLRAALLASDVFRSRGGLSELGEIGQSDRALRRRITYRFGEAYDLLRQWLLDYRNAGGAVAVDQYFSLLFEQVLGRPRFGFHDNIDAARAANQLVESARSLRWTLDDMPGQPDDYGAGYSEMVAQGVLGALRVPAWEPPANAVLISPISAFLVRNRAADYQFWLDAGSLGWWEHIYQPLTHMGILSRHWPAHVIWSDADEYRARQESMRNQVVGLLRRTTRRVYVMVTDYSESGYEQRGPLLGAVNRVLIMPRP